MEIKFIKLYVSVHRTQDANNFLCFALYIVKLQPDGKENISEAYNSLSFIISLVLGTSRRCFRIVPRIVVFFCLSSSASFRLVK